MAPTAPALPSVLLGRLYLVMIGIAPATGGDASKYLTDRAGGTLTEIARSCNVMTVIFKQ